MGKVTVSATVSLDGYVAGPDGTGSEHLFAWFAGGDVEQAQLQALARDRAGRHHDLDGHERAGLDQFLEQRAHVMAPETRIRRLTLDQEIEGSNPSLAGQHHNVWGLTGFRPPDDVVLSVVDGISKEVRRCEVRLTLWRADATDGITAGRE